MVARKVETLASTDRKRGKHTSAAAYLTSQLQWIQEQDQGLFQALKQLLNAHAAQTKRNPDRHKELDSCNSHMLGLLQFAAMPNLVRVRMQASRTIAELSKSMPATQVQIDCRGRVSQALESGSVVFEVGEVKMGRNVGVYDVSQLVRALAVLSCARSTWDCGSRTEEHRHVLLGRLFVSAK